MPAPTIDWCPYCGGLIEPNAPQGECPWCGKQTPFPAVVAGHPRSNPNKRTVQLAIATLAIIALVLLSYIYRRFLFSGLNLVAEATGGRLSAALALALGLAVLGWVLVWMLFPIFVYLGLRDLRRRTARLERATMLCAHYSSRVAVERVGPKTSESPKEQEPDAESP